ncbi:helix-turn-helix transcriptional regulator, partial [Christensenellaceae bacterium OttesenSCG-928-M15]|nr:helix-turn-helix transcriptional regulator [Christensenellaceae bacterium OttesenSCG-928-M15]
MDKTQIGMRIMSLRREKGLTQEQLAGMLGVSGPAVSKWEQGRSLPDVLLLAPLARALSTNVDGLLAFEERLSEERVAKLEKRIGATFEGEGYEAGYEAAEAYLKEYPNSSLLKFRVAGLYMRYLLLVKEEKQAEVYIRRMLALQLEVVKSGDPKLSVPAMAVASNIHSMLGEYDEAEVLVNLLPKADIRSEMYYPQLYTGRGEHEKAEKCYQQNLYRAASDMVMALVGLIGCARQLGAEERALALSETYKRFIELFEYPDVNAQLMRFSCYKALHREEEAYRALEEYVRRVERWNMDLADTVCFYRLDNVKKNSSTDLFKKAAYEAAKSMLKNPEDDP